MRWHEALFSYRPGRLEAANARNSAPFMPRNVVTNPYFGWGDDRPPRTPYHETVTFEAHVRGLTLRHPEIAPELRGTYAGLASPVITDHLTRLGVTAINLMPVHQFVSERELAARGRTNYWGYNTIAFLAPHNGYSSSAEPDGQVAEFKLMVKTLHAAGIQVILDIGYNHTAGRLDLTDVFVFRSADNPDNTVLIIDSNPTSAPPPIPARTTGPEFHPDAVHRINVDNNGDAAADIAFTFTFSEFENGMQTAMAWYATGSQAREPGPVGEQLCAPFPISFDGSARAIQAGPIRLFAGLRSDPFFADVEGALHGFQWTGHDDFADNNVDSIALEVPSDLLGSDPVIGVWASISLRRDGALVLMDRGGNPTINPFINPDGQKNLYNSRQPADDVANYLGP